MRRFRAAGHRGPSRGAMAPSRPCPANRWSRASPVGRAGRKCRNAPACGQGSPARTGHRPSTRRIASGVAWRSFQFAWGRQRPMAAVCTRMARFLCVRITGNPAAAAHPAFRPGGGWRARTLSGQASPGQHSIGLAEFEAVRSGSLRRLWQRLWRQGSDRCPEWGFQPQQVLLPFHGGQRFRWGHCGQLLAFTAASRDQRC